MTIDLIQVPYDSGQRNRRMGSGPFHLRDNGAVDALHAMDFEVRETVIEATSGFRTEIATTFELLEGIARRVGLAVAEDSFPLVVAGNCNSTVGAMSGLSPLRAGLVWLDGHGDFNTPETSSSGFLDGMALAMITGRCWKPLTARIPGFRKLDDERVVLIGARDFDAMESEQLQRSGITLVGPDETRDPSNLEACLAGLGRIVDQVYFHVDLDVHDPSVARANHVSPSGGLHPNEVVEIVKLVASRFSIAGASITAFDPECDVDNRTLQTGLELIRLLSELASTQRSGTRTPREP